jgi:hypothetical protein
MKEEEAGEFMACTMLQRLDLAAEEEEAGSWASVYLRVGAGDLKLWTILGVKLWG